MLLTARKWPRVVSVAMAVLAAINAARLIAQPASPQFDLSTYFGGSGGDSASVVRVDAAGNYYLAGSTSSRDFPTRDSVFPVPPSSGSTPTVGFLTKLRADGTIVYSRYLARPLAALAVDAQGNATIADNVPAFLRGRAGDFVISSSTQWRQLYAVVCGQRARAGDGVALDETGAVIITGNTDSPDFPLLNALQPAVLPGDDGFDRSAFVTKLDALGRIVFSTGWGGTGEDLGAAVAIDRSGAITVAGTTRSIDFPTSANAFQRTLFSPQCSPFQSPCADVFITKFSADGQTVVYSTLFGGTNADCHVCRCGRRWRCSLRGHDRVARSAPATCHPTNVRQRCSSQRLFQLHRQVESTGTSQCSTYFGSLAYYVSNLDCRLPASRLTVRAAAPRRAPSRQRPSSVSAAAGVKVAATGEAPMTTARGPVRAMGCRRGIWFLAAGGCASQAFYASTFGQLFRSDDQGLVDRTARHRPGTRRRRCRRSARTDDAVFDWKYRVLKSTDGESGRAAARSVIHDLRGGCALSPSNVYVTTRRGLFHSPNGGVTWSSILDVNPADNPASPRLVVVAVDPRDADTLYVALSDGSIRRRAAQQWSPVGSLTCPVDQLIFAAAPPSTMYALACGNVWKSVDGARSWKESSLGRMATSIALDRSAPDDVYVAASTVGIYRSRDRGETWALMSDPTTSGRSWSILPNANDLRWRHGASTLLQVRPFRASFSTYLGGVQSSSASAIVAPNGTIVVAGGAGRDFPLVHPFSRLTVAQLTRSSRISIPTSYFGSSSALLLPAH
jgi:hypothetical protein